MPFLIGLAGPAGVGKSTLARAIREARPRALILSPADAIRAALGGLYEWAQVPDDEIASRLDGRLKRAPCPVLGTTPTHAMQTLGTEWGRTLIAPDLWSRLWAARARSALWAGVPVVNASVRFADEVEAVHALGGLVVGLRGSGDDVGGHASERGVEPDAWIPAGRDPAHAAAWCVAVVERPGGVEAVRAGKVRP